MRFKAGVSVRNLVEFILREGDIDKSSGQGKDVDSMQQGTKIHKKIQKSMGSNYQAEVPLKLTVYVEGQSVFFSEDKLSGKEDSLELTLEGRADGVLTVSGGILGEADNDSGCTAGKQIIIDEIKAVNRDVENMEKPVKLHLSQAECYAFMYWKINDRFPKAVQLTYCSTALDGTSREPIKRFLKDLDQEELSEWFEKLILSYAKWIFLKEHWVLKRNESLSMIKFPFPYREGQKKLAEDIYRTILRKKRIFIQAPTGVGKTVSTLFPAMKAMGEGLSDKIFYLTAKTITRQVAEETLGHFDIQGLSLKRVTLTAKEKICLKDKMECTPETCEMACGHYDRVNDAVFELLCSEERINRAVIEDYAKKHKVCPFEMSLDISLWCDVIIGDYNYAFDPEVKLKRFFSEGTKEKFIFLVDEAHNLVERARDMYSAVLIKEDFLRVKKLVSSGVLWNKKLLSRLATCNKDFLKQKRECEEVLILKDIDSEYFHLFNLQGAFDEFLQLNRRFPERDKVLEFYFDLCKFLSVYESINNKYRIYGDFNEIGEYRLNLCCMDPSGQLSQCLDTGVSSIFFSATLLPVQYYREQLGGRQEDYAVYAPSPFLKENRLIMVAGDVSTRYKRRGPKEYGRILLYLHTFSTAHRGNYMFFFPSYKLMEEIANMWEEEYDEPILRQKAFMTEGDREDFLACFDGENAVTAFCVLGGIFGEGIDLKGERLVGAAVVGTGLPMVCRERQLYKEYFDKREKDGFKYAYQYPGMNKVMQAAGRVIRTMEDRGCVLLMDERFENREYKELFPREWFPYYQVGLDSLGDLMDKFWGGLI